MELIVLLQVVIHLIELSRVHHLGCLPVVFDRSTDTAPSVGGVRGCILRHMVVPGSIQLVIRFTAKDAVTIGAECIKSTGTHHIHMA